VDEDQDDVNWGDPESSPTVVLVESATATSNNGPNVTPFTTWGLLEPMLAKHGEEQVAIEGDTTYLREVTQHI
jgi:hypothetical protein